MIKLKIKGSFKNTERLFSNVMKKHHLKVLERLCEEGVECLSANTPVDTGKTADSWGYRISENDKGVVLWFTNSNVNKGVNIAIILQYGHATGTGGYVKGRDYINPAIQPIFDEIAHKAWMEVVK